MIGPALSTRLPFEADDTTVLGGQFRAEARALLRRLARGRRRRPRRPGGGDALDHAGLRRRPARAAPDEPARLPRPHAARLAGDAAAASPASAARRTPTAIAMQRGGTAADVWVVSHAPGRDGHACCRPQPRPTPASGPASCRAAPATTSSGSAATSSAPRATMRLTARLPRPPRRDRRPRRAAARLLRRLSRRRSASTPTRRVPAGADRACSTAPIISAGNVRDRFSHRRLAGAQRPRQDRAPDGRARHARRRRRPRHERAPAQDHRLLRPRAREHVPLHRLALPVDRPLARARASPCRARSPGSPIPRRPDGALDLAVEIGDSVMSHRRRYAVTTTRETVVDLLALDTLNPRSVLYHLTEIRDHVALPARRRGQRPDVAAVARRRCRPTPASPSQTPDTARRRRAPRADRRDRGALQPALRHLPALSACSTTSA